MTISRQNLSIVVVSFMSEKVIYDCINSISNDIEIIIVDNSNNPTFKEKIQEKYKNVRCILSQENNGMGAGNNLGLKNVKTDYALILNPDVTLEINTIDEIIKASKTIESFGVIAPISNNLNYPNYKADKKLLNDDEFKPFKVKSVDGYAMLLNIKRLKKHKDFKNLIFFDENFFLYLENDDICKRIIKNNENIYIIPNAKVNHLGGSAVDSKYKFEIELSRNWHWIWSKFYFNKKHKGYLFAVINGFPTFTSGIFKLCFYSFFDKEKKKIYLQRIKGYISALTGKKAFYRPKIDF